MLSCLGWISLHRQIMNGWLWEDKPFAYGQAWIDMLMTANHEDNDILFEGKIVTIHRGSFHTSILKLSDRYGWNRKRTTKFLDLLEKQKMVTTERTTHGTTITIVNYDKFQSVRTTIGTTERITQGTTEEQPRDTNNNDNNDNNVNNINYQQIADMYNATCVSFPRLTKLSEKRKKAIKARLKTYTVNDFQKLFEMAEDSIFLKGQNERNWSATFDWMIADANMAKILDGNYCDKNKKGVSEPVGNNTYNTDAEWERVKRVVAEARESGKSRENIFG